MASKQRAVVLLGHDRGQEPNRRAGQGVELVVRPAAHQERPRRLRKGRQMRRELFFVLLGVQVHVLHDGGLELLDGARLRLVVRVAQSGVAVAHELQEHLRRGKRATRVGTAKCYNLNSFMLVSAVSRTMNSNENLMPGF